jgi:hypothetical protein
VGFLEATALKILAFVGIGEVGLTNWIFIVLGVAVVAGLLGRLWDRRARRRADNDQG